MIRRKRKLDFSVFFIILIVGLGVIIPYQNAQAIGGCFKTVDCWPLQPEGTYCVCVGFTLSGSCDACFTTFYACYVDCNPSGSGVWCFC